MTPRTAWEQLIAKYADGRQICNCQQAYETPCGLGYVNGVYRTDLMTCEFGCSANQLFAKEEIALRVEVELDKIGTLDAL